MGFCGSKGSAHEDCSSSPSCKVKVSIGTAIATHLQEEVVANCSDLIVPVVPANAGTHNPWHWLWKKASTPLPKKRTHGVWVPASAGTTRYESTSSRHHAPEFCQSFSPQRRRGRRKCRVHGAPAARVQGTHTVVTTGPPKTPGIPCAMVLTVSFVLSPATNSSCHRRQRIDDSSRPGWAPKISAGLTSATDAKTTRLRRTQRPHRYPFDRHVCRRSKVWRRH